MNNRRNFIKVAACVPIITTLPTNNPIYMIDFIGFSEGLRCNVIAQKIEKNIEENCVIYSRFKYTTENVFNMLNENASKLVLSKKQDFADPENSKYFSAYYNVNGTIRKQLLFIDNHKFILTQKKYSYSYGKYTHARTI